jgi:hypothetical protein
MYAMPSQWRKWVTGFGYYKISQLTPFLFPFLLLPGRPLQTRKPDSKPQLRSAKSMNLSHALLHLHDQKSCPHDIFYSHDMQLFWRHACPNMRALTMCKNVQPTWCCIRTQSLFISVKFWSTNSTASDTVSASLQFLE